MNLKLGLVAQSLGRTDEVCFADNLLVASHWSWAQGGQYSILDHELRIVALSGRILPSCAILRSREITA